MVLGIGQAGPCMGLCMGLCMGWSVHGSVGAWVHGGWCMGGGDVDDVVGDGVNVVLYPKLQSEPTQPIRNGTT